MPTEIRLRLLDPRQTRALLRKITYDSARTNDTRLPTARPHWLARRPARLRTRKERRVRPVHLLHRRMDRLAGELVPRPAGAGLQAV